MLCLPRELRRVCAHQTPAGCWSEDRRSRRDPEAAHGRHPSTTRRNRTGAEETHGRQGHARCEIHPVNAYLTDLIPALVRRDEEQTDHVELAAGFDKENQGALLVVPVAAVGRHRVVNRHGC
jgi:hypothetical protein